MRVKTKASASETDASKAAALLTHDIITTEIKPGSRLYIRDMMIRTDLGATPLREGVTRLVARGLVEIVDQKGFYVTKICDADSEDLFWLISVLEQAALRRSMEQGDQQWICGIEEALKAFTTFKPARRERPAALTRHFCDYHKALHMAFVSACGSPRTLALLDILYDLEMRVCHARTNRTHRLRVGPETL